MKTTTWLLKCLAIINQFLPVKFGKRFNMVDIHETLEHKLAFDSVKGMNLLHESMAVCSMAGAFNFT